MQVLTLNLWHRNDDSAAVSELIRPERPHIVALIELTPLLTKSVPRARLVLVCRLFDTPMHSVLMATEFRGMMDRLVQDVGRGPVVEVHGVWGVGVGSRQEAGCSPVARE